MADAVYITANLTAPADLRVTSGGQTSILHLPAGSTDAQAPLFAGGAPNFVLVRGGRILMSGSAAEPIETAPAFNNDYYATGELMPTLPGAILPLQADGLPQ